MSELGSKELQAVEGSARSPEDGVDSTHRFLCFSLGAEEYAIPLLQVKEVMGLPEITPIPQSPPYFLGIVNLRGQVISVIDLRIKLGMKPEKLQEMAVVICDLENTCLGVVVDSVNSVISPKKDEIQAKSELKGSRNNEYITGVFKQGSKLVLFLNLVKALNLEDLINRAKAAAGGK